MRDVVNASLSVLNTNSYSLENQNCIPLARSEDKGLTTLCKILNKSASEIGVSKRRSYVLHTSREGEVHNQIHFFLIYLCRLSRDNMTQYYPPVDHKISFFPIKGQMLILTPSYNFSYVSQAILKRAFIYGEVIHENLKTLLNKIEKYRQHTFKRWSRHQKDQMASS